jgi:Ser/Thr protein kinase RdoA (MazF antagonist)
MMRWPPSDLDSIQNFVRQAREHWPIITGALLEVHQRENVICRVATSHGDCALRLHRPGLRDAVQLASELSFMAALRGAGISVPQPFAATQGRHFAMLDGIQADLLLWLPGTPIGRSRVPLALSDAEVGKVFHALGRAVAELHGVADRWSPLPGFSRPVLDLNGLLGEAPVWGRFWQLSSVDARTVATLATARAELKNRIAALVPGLSYGLIHADVVRENVLRDGDHISFIDFDDSGFGFRIYDLATCLVKSRFEDRYAVMEAAILAGYQSIRPLSREELQALPLLIAVRALSLVGWMEQRISDPGAVERRNQFLAEAMTELRGL